MTNLELENRMQQLTGEERKITREVLHLISLCGERRLYLERGFPSLFEWMVRGYGYSEAAAQRRIQAARLLKVAPSAGEMLESGKITLTALAKTQSAIRAQEKFNGELLPVQRKIEALENVAGKSNAEAERALVGLFPAIESTIFQERKTVINENVSRLAVNLTNETLAELQRIRELLSHALPEENLAGVITYIAKDFLRRKDPVVKIIKASQPKKENPSSQTTPKITAAAAKRCVKKEIRAKDRAAVLGSSLGCAFIDTSTGRRCGSRYQLEVDHIKPRAMGGGNERENLRALCRKHNLWMAEQILGESAQRYKHRIRP